MENTVTTNTQGTGSIAGCPYRALWEGGALPFPPKRETPLEPPAVYSVFRGQDKMVKARIWDGTEAWLVSKYDDFRTILGDPRFSVDLTKEGFPTLNAGMKVARGNYRSLISMDPPEHTKHRRMLMGEFTIKRVNELRNRLQKIVDQLIDSMLQKGNSADLVSDFALPIPSMVICELLGVPYEDHDFFQNLANVITSHDTTREEAIAATHELCEVYLRQLIQKKDAHPSEDILSRLIVKYVRPGELTVDELIGMARLLLIAGHETTANFTAMGVLLLLLHPDQLEIMRASPANVPPAVEEILRYLDITHLGRRRLALEDVRLGDELIKAGDAVIALSLSANRDERSFPDADRFDVTREARHHVSFGYGIHQCLGQPLARAELEIAFETLFRRIPDLRLAESFQSLQLSFT